MKIDKNQISSCNRCSYQGKPITRIIWNGLSLRLESNNPKTIYLNELFELQSIIVSAINKIDNIKKSRSIRRANQKVFSRFYFIKKLRIINAEILRVQKELIMEKLKGAANRNGHRY